MTTVQSTRNGIASRTAASGRFRQLSASPRVLARFEDRTEPAQNAMNPGELQELVLLDEFLACHVRSDGLRDVQCMLLWSEWVRTCQRTTRRFPRVVLEREFREVVTNRMGVEILQDEIRGAIYPGLRFVP